MRRNKPYFLLSTTQYFFSSICIVLYLCIVLLFHGWLLSSWNLMKRRKKNLSLTIIMKTNVFIVFTVTHKHMWNYCKMPLYTYFCINTILTLYHHVTLHVSLLPSPFLFAFFLVDFVHSMHALHTFSHMNAYFGFMLLFCCTDMWYTLAARMIYKYHTKKEYVKNLNNILSVLEESDWECNLARNQKSLNSILHAYLRVWCAEPNVNKKSNN